MERMNMMKSHLSANPTSGKEKLLEKNPDDVVFVAAYRTALTKGGKGAFKNTASGEILAGLLKGIIEKSGIDPKLIEDVAVGNVCNPGAGVNEHRAAQLIAGIPHTTPFHAINRQCSSGLMAVNSIATAIAAGQIDIGLGAGVESMSNNYGANMMTAFPERFLDTPEGMSCLIPMGSISDNASIKFNFTRNDVDEYAALSFQKAEKALAEGLFKEEILPVTGYKLDDDDNATEITVDTDEGVRKGVTAEGLGKLRSAFSPDGVTTAGNSSQVSDGAGAVILARRSVAQKHGLPIIGKFVHCRTAGCAPDMMIVGPSLAIPLVLKDVGISVDDVDIYELNEAFASQAVHTVRHCNLDVNKVNPRGGAIALGHPLGATGARQFATLFSELKQAGKKIGVTAMCIGGGMGAASVVVRE